MRRLEQMFIRKTSSGTVISEVDGLRALAIFMVIFYHFSGYLSANCLGYVIQLPQWLQIGLTHGDNGVPIFFTISGFILTLPFAKHIILKEKKVNIKSYLWRRITRLQPTYMVVLFGISIYYFIIQKYPLEIILSHFGASALYLHNFIYQIGSLINYVAWSLEIEFQFYLLLPFLATIFYLPKVWRRVTLIFAILTAPYLQNKFGISDLSILGYYQYFLGGILCTDLSFDKILFRSNLTKWISIFFTLLSFICLLLLNKYSIINNILYATASFTLVFSVLNVDILKNLFSMSLLKITGTISYTLYLIHFQIIAILGLGVVYIYNRTSSFWLTTVAVVVSFVLIWVISGIAFLIIEKPFMNPKWYDPIKLFFIQKIDSIKAKRI